MLSKQARGTFKKHFSKLVFTTWCTRLYLLLSQFVLPVEGHVAAVTLKRPLSRVEHLVTANVVRSRELLAANVAFVAIVFLG